MDFRIANISRIALFSGKGRIAGDSPDGLATVAGAPAKVPIRVVHRPTNMVAGFTISDANGNYEVANLNPDELFYVIAFDPSGQFNAVIRDNITPATE